MSDKLAGGIKAGSTSVSLPVVLRKTADNTENTGTLAAGVTAYYWRQGGTPTALTAISDLAAITTAWAAGGWKPADATNQPGLYRLDVDDAAFATGADWVVISVKVASCYVFYERYALTTNVVQTGDNFARLGAPAGASVSADVAAVKVDTAAVKVKTDFLPSATAGAAGGVFIAGTNAATSITTGLTAHIIGTVDTVTTYTGNTPQTGDNFARIGAAGAGLTALGDARLANLDATISSRTKPADTQAAVTLVTTTTNLTNSATNGDFTATQKASIGTAVAASAVASVTGNVGGDVVGSTGSVTAPVTVTGDLTATMKASVTTAATAATPTVATVTDVTNPVTLTSGERTALADALLDRDMATGTDSGGRTVRNALRPMRNRWTIAGTAYTVMKEDDTTPAWTSVFVTNPSAEAVTSSDPA